MEKNLNQQDLFFGQEILNHISYDMQIEVEIVRMLRFLKEIKK